MEGNIDFGIDLGTTNSAIGKYNNGKVSIFKNPRGFKEILPSAIAFRKGRILTGDKALEQLSTSGENVFTAFKREMGTDRTYALPDQEEPITPIDLSKFVLQELLGFIQDESVHSAVITIPASFDTVQSNATKKAGFDAGLEEVVLLQEPIAACLAYANENNLDLDTKQIWLVYDFGGGTFDSALVEIDHRELKVKDHLGNNFLGGVDIDMALLQKLILPKLKSTIGEGQSEKELQLLNQYLLHQIEEAKKELSVSDTTLLEISFSPLDIEEEITITKNEFNATVAPVFQESVEILKELLENNDLAFSDINRIVLVGGTTYIPFIRQQLKEVTGTVIDNSIDPTTAIVKGAAYFAGSRQKAKSDVVQEEKEVKGSMDFDLFYENTSNDEEELLTIKSKQDFKGYLRVLKTDGSFDSKPQEFKNNTSLFIPLTNKQVNVFTVQILDKKERPVFTNEISISQGIYSISGQTLPLDICLEVDAEDGHSYLEPIFKKNSILPLKKIVYKTLSKSVTAKTDDNIFINVLEGKRGTLPGSNLSIGFIAINGKDIVNDLIKGTDIELQFSISESRDLDIEVYIPSAELTLKKTFNPHFKEVKAEKMILEIDQAVAKAIREMEEATEAEQYELSARFNHLSEELVLLRSDCLDTQNTSLYKTDEKKRALLKELDSINYSKHFYAELEEFKSAKEVMKELLPQANAEQSAQANKILSQEKEIINSGDRTLIRHNTEKMNQLINVLFFKRDENFIHIYLKLKMIDASQYTDMQQFNKLTENGDIALHQGNYVLLKNVCMLLIGLLKDEVKTKQAGIFQAITGLK